jgi:hypothetical protein
MAFNFSRYNNTATMTNGSPLYRTQLAARNLNSLVQYQTPKLRYPTATELASLQIEKSVWKVGTRFYKLAQQYYGDPALWWIIPWFNQKPLETDFKLGDVVMAPLPLIRIANFLLETQP